eukprot:TRINITY_DN108_c0_g2_i2.p3 TRINITY_DN108_c0_g2~~TRINITY_DN108_c0_g2_i2.p3  ORF type:complete len:217 (+),score=12.86 TRINITY_DN108_c0_g2_i2:162-812(+)
MLNFGKNVQTLKQKKRNVLGEKGKQLHTIVAQTLGQGNYNEAVKLPTGVDVNQWIAINLVDFFHAVVALYSSISEFCSQDRCPVMNAGAKYEYLWQDGKLFRKPARLPAPDYINHLFDWIDAQLDNPTIFPQNVDQPFPSNFRDVVRTIFKRMYRVFAHTYHSHFAEINQLGETQHLNTCFKHFMIFVKHYQLIDDKELAPTAELASSLLKGYSNS